MDLKTLVLAKTLGGGGGGVTPTGTKIIEENGLYEITSFAKASVNVPPYGEGEIEITENGTADVSGKATAVVNIPPYGTGDININQNGTVNVSGKANAVVNVPPYGEGEIEITENGTVDVSGKATAIVNIEGGGSDIPDAAFNITGNCNYKFAYNGWNWFIEKYGNKITTSDITEASSMFRDSSLLKEIPFDIHINNHYSSQINCINLFSGCTNLRTAPYVYVSSGNLDFRYLFEYCRHLKEIPEDWADNIDWTESQSSTDSNFRSMFLECHSLRKIPQNLISNVYNLSTSWASIPYNSQFFKCYVLDSIMNLPVSTAQLEYNVFDCTFDYCSRLQHLTFATNNGTPYEVNWKNQTIDLSVCVGFASYFRDITDYNSGLTNETKITTNTDYQRLKDNPDRWTTNSNYSLYNHDSAVETINSLPDCSAYLATAGGTNTIKFRGESGSSTDGGAIQNLTPEEIAVATQKGWTVTFN